MTIVVYKFDPFKGTWQFVKVSGNESVFYTVNKVDGEYRLFDFSLESCLGNFKTLKAVKAYLLSI